MSVPKSPVLSCSRGILADVKLNSPSPVSNQSQNVNVVVYPKLNPENPYDVKAEEVHYGPKPEPEPEQEAKTRSVETASDTLSALERINADKDQLIKALNMMLDIYENNPLIVNKYVIADEDVLCNLIQALTGGEVSIYKQDYEPKCFEKKVSFSVIGKIIVKVGEDIYNLKYQYPAIVEFLDQHHISIKFAY